MGLAVLDGVAGDDRLERDRGQRLDDRVDEPGPRHRDQRARHAECVELAQQPPGARAPGHVLADPGDDAVEQPFDDLLGLEVDPAAFTDDDGGVEQVDSR